MQPISENLNCILQDLRG